MGEAVGVYAPGRRRILVARPDHLGDLLLTLPALEAMRRALPEVRITYLVPSHLSAIPSSCPAVAETITVAFPPLMAQGDGAAWEGVIAREAPRLRDRFDLALLPRPDDPWSGALVSAAGVPVRLGYDQPGTRFFLTHALPLPDNGHVVRQAIHLCQVATDMLGFSARIEANPGTGPCFVPGPSDEAEMEGVLGRQVSGETGPVVLHPGSGWPLKNWPARHWGRLAAEIHSRYGVDPLVVGGPGERGLVDAVWRASGGRARALTGQLSLGGLAALHRRARLVIATDSGPLHLAALVGARVVGLYGPADPLLFGPWCPPERSRAVRVQLPCSPCGTMVDPPCGATVEPACVRGIGVEAVLEAAAELLDAAPRVTQREAA